MQRKLFFQKKQKYFRGRDFRAREAPAAPAKSLILASA
jgi:hypothetical protein